MVKTGKGDIMESTLEGKYNPKDFEQKIYNDWEEKDILNQVWIN